MISMLEYIEKMRNFQTKLLYFIDNEDNEEENYENVIKLIDERNITKDKHDLKIFLYIINHISNYHHRYHHFFEKIEKILTKYQNEIQKNFSNSEIFNIFSKNKRILLYLFERNIIKIDEYIFTEIKNIPTYLEYFSPEIKFFIEENNHQNSTIVYYSEYYQRIQKFLNENFNTFNEKRKKGENENSICEIIRKDSIVEFILYLNKNNHPLRSFIDQSIFETNPLLLINQSSVTLIKYSAFFGSIQIFRYLYNKEVELTKSLWIYAIYGNNEEIINKCNNVNLPKNENNKNLNDNFDVDVDLSNIDFDDRFVKDEWLDNNITYERCVIESIKCHHNNFAYFLSFNFLHDNNNALFFGGFQAYNFLLIPNDQIYIEYLIYGCIFDYYTIVDIYLKTKVNDINFLII